MTPDMTTKTLTQDMKTRYGVKESRTQKGRFLLCTWRECGWNGVRSAKSVLRYAAMIVLMMVVGVTTAWGQSLPFVVTTDDDVTNHTEKFYWIESVGGKGFHIVPNYENNNASTTNAPTMRALWYFMESSESGYYYIINKETGTYLKKTGKAGDNGTIQVATYASADDVKFKFSFGSPEGITQGSWVIYPKYDTGNGTGWVGKRSGNLQFANGYGLKASNWNNTPVRDLNSQWFFVARNNVQWPQSGLPFVVSTNSDKHYYNINHVRSSTYNVSYDNSNYVTISTEDDDKKVWYFKEAAADPNINNLKYYYIVNASSEKYLKFTATTINGSNQNDVFKLMDYDGDAADYFQFVVVNSYDNQGNSWYSIMPKLAMSKYDVSNYANSMAPSSVANNEKLDLRSDRNTDKGHWVFVETDYVAVEAPTITNNLDGTISLSTTTTGATIYYTTNGDTPDNTSTPYSSAFSLGDATVIKAIAYVGATSSDVTTYNVPQYDAPTISFNSDNSQVTITCAGATNIYYTTNGNTPTTSSTLYSAPFTVSSGATIKAIATHAGYLTSTVAELAIAQVATPTIQDNGSNAISITCDTDGATIYYTTNGDTPTTSSTEYTGPLTENVSGVTIKAIAVKENMIPSAVGSGSVTLQCATPVITRDGMTFSISCCMPTDATFYYSLDGSTPATQYNGPVAFTTGQLPMTVKAVAKHASYTDSELATFDLLNGSGTSSDPYLIYGASDFANFITNVNNGTTSSACYKLEADVSASGVSAITTAFTGTFDGGLHTISGLGHALFNTIDGGTVKNVILQNVNISTGTNVGAICNEATGASRIYNCGILPTTVLRNDPDDEDKITGFNGSSIGGSGNVGGIVGLLSGNARVINCYSYATITGGATVAGIVGNIGYAANGTITQDDVATKPMVVNCMFYGDITGGTSKSPVYGGADGAMIKNDAAKGVNPYCYYRKNASFDNTYNDIKYYKRSWPAEEKNLTRFEYYRSILNSNRRLCTWWVNGANNTAPTDDDVSDIGIAKWVLDPSIAPYPILKEWGKYPSIINPDPDKRTDPSTKAWVNRDNASSHWETHAAPDTDGQILGSITVSIDAGDHHSGTASKTINITAMDKESYDYCYGKIQLPYYNEIFGDPDGDTWSKKYGDNYGEYVVTGWDITEVNGSTSGAGPNFVANWETGYNFADRTSTKKDLKSVSGRTFAQGGYYYVPDGVTSIKIKAHWGKAVYLANRGYSIDRVNVTNAGYKADNAFASAGTIANTKDGIVYENSEYTFQGQTVYDDLQNAIKALGGDATNSTNLTVFDQAIVLIGNHQVKNGGTSTSDDKSIGFNLDGKWHPFTFMSADFDFDNEPDYCLQLQFRSNTDRPGIQPIRFDFLPVIELGLAVRHNKLAYAIGVFIPQGHFEITETSFMRTTQFEWDSGQHGGSNRIDNNAPVILNGGEFEQLTVRYGNGNRTGYFLVGGHLWFHRFAPGAHPHIANTAQPRLCAVNAIGGDFPEFYLSGLYKPGLTPHTNQGNPHCYIDGGNFGSIYGAGYDKIAGSVTFKINHSLIGEFYGGGINGTNPIGGNIDVKIDNSRVSKKYCGGPVVGNMTGKTITTSATGTTFEVYYGGGNGGNSYYRELQWDGDLASSYIDTWSNHTVNSTNVTLNWDGFDPLGVIDDDNTTNKGYHAEYEFEVFNQSNGVSDQITQRGFIKWIQFGITKTGDVTNTLSDCKILNSFYGGGNLATVVGHVTSTLTNTEVDGNVFGAGYSAAIPTFQVHDKDNKSFPEMDFAGTITDGHIPYASTEYEWTNDPDDEEHDAEYMKEHPTYSKTVNGVTKWYCYTWNSLEDLGAVTGTATLSIEGTTTVAGNVYGGGEESNVQGNTQVNVTGGTISQNVFGGGKGSSENYECDKAMVGVNNAGAGANPADPVNIDKGTKVIITGGTVNGDVYGGGEVGRVEWNTQVTIGTVGDTNDSPRPVISGNVFGAGAGVETHGYSALVRGNSTVTVQGKAKVLQNVYGGGENATVGRYWVKGINNKDAGGNVIEAAKPVPDDLPNGMPYKQQSGGICTVVIQDNAQIGPDDGGTETAGHVFGAGKGVLPQFIESGTGQSQKMVKGDAENPDRLVPFTADETHATAEDAYLEFLQTLALVTNSNVTIDGSATVKGSVYGGSESGYVQHNATVTVSGGTIGTSGSGGAYYGNVYGGGKGDVEHMGTEHKYVAAGLVKGNTNVTISGMPTILHNIYGGGAYGSVGEFTYDATTGLPTALATENTGACTVTITGGTLGSNGNDNGMVFGSSRGDVATPVGDPAVDPNDRLAWVYSTHVTIGDTNAETSPTIKGSVYGSGENGHTFQNTIVDIQKGTIGITTGETIGGYSGAQYPYRGNVYGGGCGTDMYDSDGDGNGDTYNPLAGIVRGNATLNISGGHVVHNVYGAGAMGSVGTTDNTGAITSGGTTTINISDGTIGVSGTVGDGNVFGAARGDAATTQTDLAIVKTTNVTISNGTVKGNVYGGGETGDVGTYTTDANDANIYPEGSGICNVSITGGTIGVDGNGNGNVFGAGKGDAGTFKCMKAMVYKTNVAVSNGTVWGNVYGGGEIGRVENDTKVEIGTEGEITDTSKPDIKGSVFGAGKGLDTHGYSALVRGNPDVTVQGSAKVGRNVYGGGEIASVGKHSLVTDGNKDQHPELEVGMPFTLANNSVGVCTVTVKDKAEITGNVFGAGKGVKPAEMVNPGRMTPTGTMEYYNASTYGTGWENALHIYVQTLALVTDTHVSIGGTATGTATKVLGSVYGGSESGFVQYNTNVAINQNCTIGTSSVEGNVYGGGLGIAGNDVAGRVGGNTKIDINNGTTHGSVFGGGAYGVVKGSVNVNINDGIIDKDVYGGGALAHTNTGMWDDAHNALLEYAEVKNLIVDSSPVTGYFTRTGTEGNYTYSEITAANTTAASETTYYAKYTTTVNLTGGKLRNAYGGGLGVHDIGEDGQTGYVEGTPAYVYGDVMVKLNEGVTSANASTTKGCIVEKVFGCNNLKGTPKGHVQVHVYATQNANTGTYPHITPKHAYHTEAAGNLPETGSTSTYDVLAVYGGGNLAPFDPVDAYSTDASKKAAARCEVIIDGCGLTSIRQVYAGGNAAPAPATLVQVYGTYEIEEVFGGGNGKDDYTVNNGTTDEWFKNPGANVGYRNYTHLVGGESGGDGTSAHPYVCAENSDALTKEARQTATLGDGSLKYMYGSGVATTEIYGGKIHYVYGGSNEKGNISIEAMSIYEEESGAGSCDMDLDQTYGGGKNSEIDGTINMGLGCVQNMKETFGGSKNADVNSDIVLNITNGTYERVFGGNNTSGNINGSITVNIYEDGCSPVRIGELYLGGYLADYSIYGYKADRSVRTKAEYDALSTAEKAAITVRKDPRINIISATRIDKVFGGGYEATVVGNPHVNVNMEKGRIKAKYVDANFTNEHSNSKPYYTWTGESVDATSGDGILPIGTVGTIYGGGNLANIIGDTYVEIGNGFWLKQGTNDVWETKNAAGATYTYEKKTGSDAWKWYDKNGEEVTTPPTPIRYTAKITGNVFGGGYNAAVQGNTHVNICAVNADDPATADDIEMIGVTLPTTINSDVTIDGSVYGGGSKGDVGHYTMSGRDYIFDTGTGISNVTIAGGTVGPETPTETSPGNVFGGGMGEALDSGTGAFMCEKAMVDYTNVVISNGKVNGTVYGGGEIGRVNHDTRVTIGLKRANTTDPAVSTPVVEGSAYGAGKGLSTHGYAALVRGNSYVTVQGDSKVKESVYGGGEIASVGKYTLDDAGMPQSLANRNSGYCNVIVRDNAEIGPDEPMYMITTSGYPDDKGHVFGGGKGVLPYEGYDLTNSNDIPWRVKGNDKQQWFGEGVYVYEEGKEISDYKKAYLRYIETQGLATQTYVTIGGNALVKGSVYGGSMNGHVQHNTQVTIAGGQIGCQKNTTGRLDPSVWGADYQVPDGTDLECASWEFTGDHLPYDIYDYQTGTTKPKPATDGHTFFGNVFGGGSGYYPYRQDPDYDTKDEVTGKSKKDLGYSDGLWHREAGSVGGSTVVNITGGHILTSVYGGNEQTDVGTYVKDGNYENTTTVVSGGKCTINMSGGTVGVPRTVAQMKAHPVTCYVFGAGKGDQRINFNKWTNVASTQVNISGDARIYGSTFGGGEDGHVVGNVETNIGGSFNMKINNVVTPVTYSNVRIGTTGTSGVDGNIFGGGRGFSETALTAGVVGGDVAVNIHNGTILGSVFGGGRLASVGTHFADTESADYGTMQNTITPATYYTAAEIAAAVEGDDAYGKTTSDIKTPESIHGKITVTIDGGTIGATDSNGKLATSDFSIGDVFGGCKGSPNDVRFGMSKNTFVNISGANTKINGNVYGGGESGDVGSITRDLTTYNYSWKNSDGDAQHNNNENANTAKNSGVCTVTISGGEIGDGGNTSTKGNVFGAGKGVANTFWCEKAMAYATKVSISGATTVNGNVYGGGEVGRVEDDAKVEINTSGGSEVPDIKGNVYGAGAGLETHGYSALVRGNSIVTIKGNTKVGGSVFGGGETASLGRFKLDERKMPKEPDGGGSSTVTITDNAKIGLSGTDHDVYGAGQGVEPNWVYTENSAETPYATRITNSKRMMTYASGRHKPDDRYKTWDYYEDNPSSAFVWEYYPTEAAYLEYLTTLAIASNPTVTIEEGATVHGDVYGGGQRGITLGNVSVNITGGTVKQDVYGGGSLADTNKGNWDDSQYSAVTLPAGHTLTDLYTRSGSGTTDSPYTYTEATSSTGAEANTTYYSKGTWATGKYNESTHATTYKTNVILTGGEIEGDVYGGGLGQIAREAVAAQEAQPAQGTEGEEGYVPAVPAVAAQPALSAVKAKVYGDVLVKLNEDTSNDVCKVHGNIFGCNNQNGSPQSAVTVHVYKTEGWTEHMRTGKQLTGSELSAALNDPVDSNHSYELKGVYGGGNLSAFYPDLKATRDTVQAYVIIDGCDLTSIQTVYGGGNAASVPASNVTINATYEIEEVFGGGNGKEAIKIHGVTKTNPGANVGYEEYPTAYDIPESSKTERTSKFSYGSGKANVTIYDGLIHRVFGGSNTKGNVRESAVTLLDDMSGCHFQVDEAYGGGKNAPMDAEATLLMACIPGLKVAYGGAENADVLGGVNLTITNGTYERVFGGNNISGTIQGPIVVNVEETGCRPIIIGELYGGGNLAGYSIYGYKEVGDELVPRESADDGEAVAGTPYPSPVINVKSFTSIGNIFGGGYGASAKMVGNPTVNVNVVKGKYAETYNGSDNEIEDNAKVVGSGWTSSTSAAGYDSGYPIPSHVKGAIGAINNVFGGGNEAEVKGTPHVNIGTMMGEPTTLVSKKIEDSEGHAPSDADWTPSYAIMTVEGADIRGNVYGGGNNAPVDGDTDVQIGKNNAIKTYSFTSYSAESGGTAYSTGLAQTTGEVKKVSDTEYAEVVILTNGSHGEFVGQKFYVSPTVTQDGSTRTQLKKDVNGTLTDTGIYVAIKPFEKKKTYSFTSWSAASDGTKYSDGTATATGNFKTFSSTEYMQIQVLTNPGETSWEGKTFYVPANTSTGGTTRTQLYKADGTPIENVWVSITE